MNWTDYWWWVKYRWVPENYNDYPESILSKLFHRHNSKKANEWSPPYESWNIGSRKTLKLNWDENLLLLWCDFELKLYQILLQRRMTLIRNIQSYQVYEISSKALKYTAQNWEQIPLIKCYCHCRVLLVGKCFGII